MTCSEGALALAPFPRNVLTNLQIFVQSHIQRTDRTTIRHLNFKNRRVERLFSVLNTSVIITWSLVSKNDHERGLLLRITTRV